MPPKPQPQKSEYHVGWTTITYRSVALGLSAIFAIILIALHFTFPETSASVRASITGKISEWMGSKPDGPDKPEGGPKKAHFTAIEGTVKVKKNNSSTFTNADYDLPLEKGDVVQTGSEGMAKIVFADGTNYTVRQDSLIVIEENSTNAAQQTRVAVQVTTGTVDLATATFTQGSRSQVKVAGATATLGKDTTAVVSNDPRGDRSDILVKKGSGEVQRGTEVVSLNNFERVSFKADSPTMTKVKEIAPPILITPANMAPLFSAKAAATVEFTWTPVDNAAGYRVRLSRNPYFSSTILDQRVRGESLKLNNVGEGAYYWMVTSFDGRGKESIESEKNRFNIVQQNAGAASLALELDPFVQHGRVIEVRGKTEPSARVMVNGEEVPIVNSDGKFNYFTPPLPSGENMITVTAQNARGGHNTLMKKVVIQ